MPNKFVGAFKFFTKGSKKGKVAPTITQPRQLKTTMKRIQSENKRFGFTKAKTAKDRANIVRRKKSIERMEKLQKAQNKRKEGIKASKEVKKMIDTGQADRVGSSVYHRGVREKKAMGGIMSAINKLRGKEEKKPKRPGDQPMKPRDKRKPVEPIDKGPREKLKKVKPEPKKESIKDKIVDPKKKKRLDELRKELGMKKGGKAKFPDLTGDGKITRADILKGRGVFRKGGATRPTGKVLEAIKQDYKKNKPPKGSKKPGRK